MNITTTKVSFEIKNPANDLIDGINGVTLSGVDMYTLTAALPGLFWIEPDIYGQDKLCSTLVLGNPFYLTVNSATNPYQAAALPFIPIETGTAIFGSHPPIIFKPGGSK